MKNLFLELGLNLSDKFLLNASITLMIISIFIIAIGILLESKNTPYFSILVQILAIWTCPINLEFPEYFSLMVSFVLLCIHILTEKVAPLAASVMILAFVTTSISLTPLI